MPKLYKVTDHEICYDCISSAIVVANSPEEAIELVRDRPDLHDWTWDSPEKLVATELPFEPGTIEFIYRHG